MRFAEKLKRPVYIASRYVENGVSLFNPAKTYAFNYRTVKSDTRLVVKGIEYQAQIRILAPNADIVGIKPLDRVWLSLSPSTDEFGNTAEYVVVSAKQGAGGAGEVLLSALESFRA